MISRAFRLLPWLLTTLVAGAAEPAPNTLTDAEKADGWRLLFDGRSTEGWRGYKKPAFPAEGWVVRDGCLGHVGKGGGGDIVTREKYSDYEFRFDWKINPGGNSGVKYFVNEEHPQAIGHEYQLLGPRTEEEARRDPKHATASFYDVLPVSTAVLPRPPGEWNQSRIVVHGRKVEHWLNDHRVLSYELGSETVKEAIAKSKFRTITGFGDKVPHHLLLQDHGGEIWFRNLRIRPL